MNRTALGVLALAVEVLLIIGLYNIYKPEITTIPNKVIRKVNINSVGMDWPKRPQTLHNGFAINDEGQYEDAIWAWKKTGEININGKTNPTGMWEVEKSGPAYNPSEAPQNHPQASIQDGEQVIEGDLATKDGQPVSPNELVKPQDINNNRGQQ